MGSLTEIQDQQQQKQSSLVPNMSTIKQIDQDTIKFIASGEKINDIEIAIKELLENSVDAGARNIEIRLARFGIDAIEVEDNGSGIDERNFDSLGLRYHTSKIKDYKKLQESLETYGFRGEAISCLCNISNLTITTKTKASPTGWKLVFKSDGKIGKKEPVGRDVGTTVIIKNLFHSLPVRRRELETSAKKQYDKIVRLIYEQVLARPAIKFSLCKKNAAKKEKDFTHGGTTLQGVIITIFGTKVLESLVSIRQSGCNTDESIVQIDDKCVIEINDLDENNPDGNSKTNQEQKNDCETNGKLNTSVTELLSTPVAPGKGEFYKRSRKSKFAREKPDFKIYGFISRIGSGRNSTDCQFLFVNNKPCDVPKLSRLINEIYGGYSKGQNPFYCLFIQVQNWAVDFNVPRKRAVILQDESKLCDIVRETLEEMFSPCVPASQNSCPIAQIPLLMGFKQTDKTLNENSKRTIDVMMLEDNDEKSKYLNGSKELASNGKLNETTSELPSVESSTQPQTNGNSCTDSSKINTNTNEKDLEQRLTSNGYGIVESIPDPYENGRIKRLKTTNSNNTNNDKPHQLDVSATMPKFKNGLELLIEEIKLPTTPNGSENSLNNRNSIVPTIKVPGTPLSSRKSSTPTRSPARLTVANVTCRYNEVVIAQNDRLSVRLDYLEDAAMILEQERFDEHRPVEDAEQFSFAIHPKFNAVAEEQLKLNLNKNSFNEMKVLGQFNMGFIIARLNNHIFIIDQHATDERANYEDILGKSPLEKQEMIHPKPLFLNLIQENAILNNIEAFKSRGFEFVIDTEKLVGYRVMLRSTSICKDSGRDVYLGKEDIEELIDVILESPNRLKTYKLKKVRDVSASMACRKSVMIGDTLNWDKMENIVEKMSSLQNPWVCAHNRPTIRHLMETNWMRKDKN